jgi:hypothetical protein
MGAQGPSGRAARQSPLTKWKNGEQPKGLGLMFEKTLASQKAEAGFLLKNFSFNFSLFPLIIAFSRPFLIFLSCQKCEPNPVGCSQRQIC